MKHLSLWSIIFTLWLCGIAHAAPVTLILDVDNSKGGLPNHFRTTQDRPSQKINSTGFREMTMAGGAQFSETQLLNMLQTLHTKKMIIVDLREESHAFINGNAVSWYGSKDAPNRGKTAKQIVEDENNRIAATIAAKKVNLVIVLKKKYEEIVKFSNAKVDALKVISEPNLAKQYNLSYQRFFVTDHHMPSNLEIDRFIKFVKQLPRDQWLYFHCEAGRGRTTVFMVLYDILHNAKDVSLHDILVRQDAIGGKNFEKEIDQASSHYPANKFRFDLLTSFYQYARNNTDGFATSWTQWLQQRMKKS